MINKLILFILFVLFFFVPASVHAQVVINEFSSGTTSDWVELYNTATEAADLASYKIMDSGTNDKVLSGNIPSGGFISFGFSNWLNNDGDTVRLFNNTDLVDSISYGGDGQVCLAGSGESIGRYPDANSTIERFLTPTRDSSNNSAILNPCPTPTPEPTPASTTAPTNTPTPTSTATPASTKTPTPIPIKTKTPTPTATSVESATPESLVLGLQGEEGSPSPVASPEAKNKIPLISFIFIFLGLGFIGGAGYLVYRNSKGYNP